MEERSATRATGGTGSGSGLGQVDFSSAATVFFWGSGLHCVTSKSLRGRGCKFHLWHWLWWGPMPLHLQLIPPFSIPFLPSPSTGFSQHLASASLSTFKTWACSVAVPLCALPLLSVSLRGKKGQDWLVVTHPHWLQSGRTRGKRAEVEPFALSLASECHFKDGSCVGSWG